MNFFSSDHFYSNHFSSNHFRGQRVKTSVIDASTGVGGEGYDLDITFKFQHDIIRADDELVICMASNALITISDHG